MFSKGVTEINSDSESEQYNSDNHQNSSDTENEPIIQETLDALTRKIQAVIGSYKMEKENILQLNIRIGYCFQDFAKAFWKNWNFKNNICHGGPGPGFFALWIYKYITSDLKELLKDLPKELSLGSLYCEIYKEVSLLIIGL